MGLPYLDTLRYQVRSSGSVVMGREGISNSVPSQETVITSRHEARYTVSPCLPTNILTLLGRRWANTRTTAPQHPQRVPLQLKLPPLEPRSASPRTFDSQQSAVRSHKSESCNTWLKTARRSKPEPVVFGLLT